MMAVDAAAAPMENRAVLPEPAPMLEAPPATPVLVQAEPPVEMPPPAPVPPPPPPMPTDAQSLRAAYGMPAFIRREPDAELWRYDGLRCAAFFFLYPEGGTYRVRHSETSPKGAAMSADPECLRSLIVPSGAAPSAAGM
jgi:hypothetical protein